MRHLIVIATVLLVGCCEPWTAAAVEGISPNRRPPSGLMDTAEASRHWDGTGELLLMPKANMLSPKDSGFAIGATFDNSDAPKPEADAARSAFNRCPSLIYPARLMGGDLLITGPLGNPWHKQPAMRPSPDAGSGGDTIEVERCRYVLDLKIKLHEDGGWIPMGRFVRPPPPPSPGPTRVLKSGETVTIKFPPAPPELGLWTFTRRIGPYVPPEIAAKCPDLAGSLWFEPSGVYVDMPWASGDAVIPGIRRNPEARTTTPIFQKPECRLEFSVRREIREDDGTWQASLLSPILVENGD